MLEDRKRQNSEGKKRRRPGEDEGGERKRRGGDEGERKRRGEGEGRQGDGGKKRLDPMSVGYFRRVGERLDEGFKEKEERGERNPSGSVDAWKLTEVGNMHQQ